MRILVLACLVVALAAGEAPVFSDTEWSAAQAPAARPAAETPGWGTVASMGLGLLAVIGLAVGLGYAAKRLGARRLLGGRGRNLELLETIQLGPRRSLALVRLGGQWLVVGMGEKELSHIATLPAPAEQASSAFAAELNRLVPAPAPEAKP
jgi:flagellar biosynthetic protein FliO